MSDIKKFVHTLLIIGVLRLTASHHIFVNGDRTTDFAHNLKPLESKILVFNGLYLGTGKELTLVTVTSVTRVRG